MIVILATRLGSIPIMTLTNKTNGGTLLIELSVEEETILLFSKVLENYPTSIEIIQEAYIDSFLEINEMSESEKRSFVDDRIEMVKKLQRSKSNHE